MEVRFGDNNNPPESCTPLVWRGATSAERRKYHCLGYSPSLSSLPPGSGLASAHFLLNLELDNLTGQQIPVGYKAPALLDSG